MQIDSLANWVKIIINWRHDMWGLVPLIWHKICFIPSYVYFIFSCNSSITFRKGEMHFRSIKIEFFPWVDTTCSVQSFILILTLEKCIWQDFSICRMLSMRAEDLLYSGEMLLVMIVTDQQHCNKVLQDNQMMPVD